MTHPSDPYRNPSGEPDYNPYEPPPNSGQGYAGASTYQGPLKVSVSPMDLYRRGYGLLNGQYWMMLLISLAGMILGGLVPMYLIMGAMLVGIFLCLKQIEQKQTVTFGMLFQGFNQFVDSFIVVLVGLVILLVPMIPMVILYVVMLAVIVTSGPQQGPPPPAFFGGLLAWVFVFTALIYAAMLPFTFSFPLIADRQLSGMEAIKQSAQAVWLNLGGVVWFVVATILAQFILTVMCYVPAILFIPIQFAGLYVLYRDIFPQPIVDAPFGS